VRGRGGRPIQVGRTTKIVLAVTVIPSIVSVVVLLIVIAVEL